MSSGPPQPGMYQPGSRFPPQVAPGMQRPPQPGLPGAKPEQQRPGFPGAQFSNGHQQMNQMFNQMNQMNIRGDQPPASSQFPTSQPGMPPQMNQLPSHPNVQPPGPPCQIRPPASQPGIMQPPGPPNGPNQTQNRYPSPMTTDSGRSGPPGNVPQPLITNVGASGVPPNSTGGPGMPSHSMSAPRMPPTTMGAPSMHSHMAGPGQGVPPTSMGGPGIPPRPGIPPSTGQHGMPPSSMGGMPLTSMGGMPPTSMGGMPPTSIGGPGMPPSSIGGPGMPPSSIGGPGMPPSSIGGPGMPLGSGMPPHSLSGAGMPPQLGMHSAPQPGITPMGGTMPGGQYPPQPTQQMPAPRKLDPDQMPSAIQVMGDDMKNRNGVFNTGGRGLVPPLVTTDFICQDQGNCNPRFLRSTMYNVPVNNDMMKQCNMPFGLVCSPYARVHNSEVVPPLVNLGEMGPVRCKRCRAYMCPFMQFIDGGRRFSCPFCNCATDVPEQYFQHLDHTGKRVDTFERPELCLGSYEFVATKDYCKNGALPNQPAFIFMIDVSYNSVKSGLVHLICQHIKDEILPNLPKEPGQQESDMRVGFVTYSDVLHFYNVKGTLVQPQMMVVGDVEDVFVPMVDGFLVKPKEADSVIESLLQMLPMMFSDARETNTVLGPVVQAGLDALRSAGCPGKLFIFHTSLPIAEAPGKLRNRDDRKLLGTEKEKTLFEPQTQFYTTLGKDCVAHGCGVDLFLFPNSYIDVSTISQVCKLSGGDVYKYDYFTTVEGDDIKADSHGTQFINDLRSAVGKQIAFDVIVRCRTSTGLRPVGFYGNFHMVNTTDVELAVVDCDKAFCIDVKHDDKLNESEGAFIQIAMLFTSVTGQRRLRIHNLSLNVCNQMADMFKNAELDTLINFLSKRAVTEQLTKSPKDVRELVANQCSDILACYRRNCATNSSHGQLILPETLKLLPLYSNCVLKNDALQAGQEVSTDTRSTLLHQVNCMDVKTSVPYFYPRLLPVHNLDPDSDELPMPVRCSYDRLQEQGAYILENGFFLYLWLGHALSSDFIQNVFGVASLAQINVEHPTVVEMSNPVSKRVHGIIKTIRNQRGRFMKLLIVRQRDKMEPWFNHYLVEDKGVTGTPSYVDYLLHIHKEIRGKLN